MTAKTFDESGEPDDRLLDRSLAYVLKVAQMPSLIYVSSAGLVLAGIAVLLSSAMSAPGLTPEHFYCLGSLVGYELAVFGVMLVVTLWRGVLDDAISLTVVIALFFTASQAALNVMASAAPELTIGLGLVLFGLTVARLGVLSRWVLGGVSPTVLLLLAVLLAAGSVWPGVMGKMVHRGMTDGQLLPVWQVGYALVCVALAILPTVLVPSGAVASDAGRWADTPFLRTLVMRAIVVLLIAVGSVVQFEAMSWSVGLRVHWAWLLPAVSPLFIAGAVLLRAYHRQGTAGYSLLLWLPLALGLAAMYIGRPVTAGPAALGLVTHPMSPVALTGLAMLVTAYRLRDRFAGAAGLVTLGLGLAVVLVCFFPVVPAKAAGVLLVGGSLIGASVLTRHPAGALASSLCFGLLSLGLCRHLGMNVAVSYLIGLVTTGTVLSGVVAVYCRELHRSYVYLPGLITGVAGFMLMVTPETPLVVQASIPVLVPCTGLILAARAGVWKAFVLFAAPLLIAFQWVLRVPAGWLLFGSGALLLLIGLGASILKSMARARVHALGGLSAPGVPASPTGVPAVVPEEGVRLSDDVSTAAAGPRWPAPTEGGPGEPEHRD